MKLTKESILKSLNSLTMPAWIKRVFQLIVDYVDDAAEGVFDNYKTQGGTKTNKTLMYKELAAQLTENTYVIDSSKLNTVLTDTEANNILNASTLIVTNAIVENNVLVFTRGSSYQVISVFALYLML